MWAERILELQKALVTSRQVTEKLCADLETPATSDRWVTLGGADPDADQLRLKVAELEERVNLTREELLEKELVLEEVTGLTERLRAAATGGVVASSDGAATPAAAGGAGGAGAASAGAEPPGLALARQVNELQAKIKEVTRKMMAVVSELSMYQATAIKLSAEAAAAQDSLGQAEAAFARGQPPSVAAQQKWSALERARLAGTPAALAAAAVARAAEEAALEGPRSAADPRPNAYVPDGIGIPKPYGEFAPFKPSEPGATMRHIRPPQPAELEI
jgi:hypothetical protein